MTSFQNTQPRSARSCCWTLLAAAALYLLGAGLCCAADQRYTARVVHISDGDTVKLDVGDRRYLFRLTEIDAPELDQPFGHEAKHALARLVEDETVTVRESGTDSYGRALGHLYLDGRDINAVLVSEGSAWVYRQYLKDESLLTREQGARVAKLGLWALPAKSRIAPWTWRHSKPRHIRGHRSAYKAQSGKCDGARRCNAMVSCAQAREALRRCGSAGLDGDGDGIPCERLCVGRD